MCGFFPVLRYPLVTHTRWGGNRAILSTRRRRFIPALCGFRIMSVFTRGVISPSVWFSPSVLYSLATYTRGIGDRAIFPTKIKYRVLAPLGVVYFGPPT